MTQKKLYVREWRQTRYLTQAQLAKRCRIRRVTTIVDLENGRVRRMRPPLLTRVAKALDLDEHLLEVNPFEHIHICPQEKE